MLACYEILEHLPYGNFHKVISEIFRVSKSYAILSTPDARRVYRFNVQIPKFGEVKRLIALPRFRKFIHKFNGEHYWGIGKSGYSLNKITNDIQKSTFKIEKTYRVFEHPYHMSFMLRKIIR